MLRNYHVNQIELFSKHRWFFLSKLGGLIQILIAGLSAHLFLLTFKI